MSTIAASPNNITLPGMVWIPGGPLQMGDAGLNQRWGDCPPVERHVDGFFMDEKHISNGRIHKYIEGCWGRPDGIVLFLPGIGPRVIGRGDSKKTYDYHKVVEGRGFEEEIQGQLGTTLQQFSEGNRVKGYECLDGLTSIFCEMGAFECVRHALETRSGLLYDNPAFKNVLGIFNVVPEDRRVLREKSKTERFMDDDQPASFINFWDMLGLAEARERELRAYYNVRVSLPTEAQWEYAARGGRGYDYGTSTGLLNGSLACYRDAKNPRRDCPEKVGQHPENPFGLFDMAGLMWQWCLDVFEEAAYSNPEILTNNPVNLNFLKRAIKDLTIVVRGGCWYDSGPGVLRAAYRDHGAPMGRYLFIGGRLVAMPQDSK